MTEDELEIGGIYRHFKGGLYELVTVARHTECNDKLVIYKSLYGDKKVWARNIEMFCGKTNDGTERFVRCGENQTEFNSAGRNNK